MAQSENLMTTRSRATSHSTKRAIRSVGVLSFILYGSILLGAVALVAGIAALIVASTTVDQGGVLSGLVHAILFVGIGVVPLIAPVLLGLFVGAVGGGVLALVYNAVARVTGGIELEMDDV